MTQTEAQWKDLPYAQRNKDLIRRWKQQIKVDIWTFLYRFHNLVGILYVLINLFLILYSEIES